MREFGKEKRYKGSRSDRDFGRRKSSDRFNRGGFRRRDEKTMHKVTCDGCGNECEVPFKPTDTKPVYCNDCFKGRGKSKSTHQCNCKEELEKINQKIDTILGLFESMKKMHTPEKKSKIAVKKKTTKKTVKKKK